MNLSIKIQLALVILLSAGIVNANESKHFSCIFHKSIMVDDSGIYEAKKFESKGFSIKDEWVNFDSGNLKLKLTTNIQKFGVVILRGGEPRKGYQFSLENGKFVYVSLMVPIARTWTVTGTCTKDTK